MYKHPINFKYVNPWTGKVNITPDMVFPKLQTSTSTLSVPEFTFDDTEFQNDLDKSMKWADEVMQKDVNKAQPGNSPGMSAGTQSALRGIGSLLGGISGNELPEQDKAVREGVRSTIGQFGPWGAAISTATGIVDAIGEYTNLNLDNIDQSSAKRAGAGFGAGFNKFANMLPGNSMLWGIFGGETNKANITADATLGNTGFSGSWQKLTDAQNLSNKRMLFQKGIVNNFINDANRLNTILTDISLDNKRNLSNYAGQLIGTNYALDNQGYKPSLSFRKHGGTIPELEEARASILSLQSNKQEESSEPKKFQLGGKMNMIVTGALHARKHNLEELNPVLEGEITKKGIPVVSFDEGGEVNQQFAEVEKEEMILEISTTKTIEDYYKDYMDADTMIEADTIALECGKFLVDQILKNTDDPDKLIKKTV